MTPDDDELADIDAATLRLRRKLTEKFGSEVDLVGLAAIGITHHAWRSDFHGFVEGAHRRRITDGEMFAANVATTRLVLEHFGSYPDVDWPSLAEALSDTERFVGQRTIVELLGKSRHKRWATWANKFVSAIARVVEQEGPESVLIGLANDGASHADWWAGPLWPQLVDTFMTCLTDDPPGMTREDLRSRLLDAPDLMDPPVLNWCTSVQLIGYTRLPE